MINWHTWGITTAIIFLCVLSCGCGSNRFIQTYDGSKIASYKAHMLSHLAGDVIVFRISSSRIEELELDEQGGILARFRARVESADSVNDPSRDPYRKLTFSGIDEEWLIDNQSSYVQTYIRIYKGYDGVLVFPCIFEPDINKVYLLNGVYDPKWHYHMHPRFGDEPRMVTFSHLVEWMGPIPALHGYEPFIYF